MGDVTLLSDLSGTLSAIIKTQHGHFRINTALKKHLNDAITPKTLPLASKIEQILDNAAAFIAQGLSLTLAHEDVVRTTTPFSLKLSYENYLKLKPLLEAVLRAGGYLNIHQETLKVSPGASTDEQCVNINIDDLQKGRTYFILEMPYQSQPAS